MTGKAFVDTNIFLYTIDQTVTTKTNSSRKLIDDLKASGRGVVSTQVINEFTVNALYKFGLGTAEVKRFFRVFEQFEIVAHSLDDARRGLDICESTQLHYWDAILVAAARSANCSILYTEDLGHGQSIQGIKIVDPFA